MILYGVKYGEEKSWKTMTYIIEVSGKFHIDFTYEQPNPNFLEKREEWEIKYFGHKLPYIKEKYPYQK